MKGTTFRRCTRSGCGARFKPRARQCPRCGGKRWSWAFVVDVGRNAAGKRRQRWRGGFATQDDADRAMRELLGQVDAGTSVDPSKVTTGQYLTAWLGGIRVKATTLDNYTRSLGKAIPRIGGIRLQALTAEDVDGLYRDLERRGKRAGKCAAAGVTCDEHGCAPERHKPLKPKSVRHVHTALHRALEDAVRRGYVPRNVTDLANPPTQKQARSRVAKDRVWTGEQLRTFVVSVAEDRLYAAWRLLATTGTRRAELLALRWTDVDLEAGTVRVGEQTLTTVGGKPVWVDGAEGGKTDHAPRTVALDGGTVAALRAWKAQQKAELLLVGTAAAWRADPHGPLVFTDALGRALHPERVLDWLQQRAKRAKLPKPTVHTVRHSYASAALKAGMRVDVLSERLGHSNPAITLSIYSHVLDGDDAAAAELAATAILGGS